MQLGCQQRCMAGHWKGQILPFASTCALQCTASLALLPTQFRHGERSQAGSTRRLPVGMRFPRRDLSDGFCSTPVVLVLGDIGKADHSQKAAFVIDADDP